MEKLKGVVSFEGWAKRIAINRSISHLRKKKVQFLEMPDVDVAAEADYDIAENEIFDCRVENT